MWLCRRSPAASCPRNPIAAPTTSSYLHASATELPECANAQASSGGSGSAPSSRGQIRARTATAALASCSEPTSSTLIGASPAAMPAPARDASVCVMASTVRRRPAVRRRRIERDRRARLVQSDEAAAGESDKSAVVGGSAQAPLGLAEVSPVHLSRADGVAQLRVAEADGGGPGAGHVERVPDGLHGALDRRGRLGGDDRCQLGRAGV